MTHIPLQHRSYSFQEARLCFQNNATPSGPGQNAEIPNNIEQARKKVHAELQALQQRIELTQKGTKESQEEAKKDLEQFRKNAAEAIVGLRTASPDQYRKLSASLNVTLSAALNDASTAAEIAAALERGEKTADAITKALTSLAAEVAPGVAYPAPSNVARYSGMVITGINSAIDMIYSSEGIGKFLRETVGVSAQDLKGMVLSGITTVLSGFSTTILPMLPGPFAFAGRFMESTARGIADELKFQDALSRYTQGDRRLVESDAAWRGRFITRLNTWERNTAYYEANRSTNPSLTSPGPRPTIHDARPDNTVQPVDLQQQNKKATVPNQPETKAGVANQGAAKGTSVPNQVSANPGQAKTAQEIAELRLKTATENITKTLNGQTGNIFTQAEQIIPLDGNISVQVGGGQLALKIGETIRNIKVEGRLSPTSSYHVLTLNTLDVGSGLLTAKFNRVWGRSVDDKDITHRQLASIALTLVASGSMETEPDPLPDGKQALFTLL